MTTSPFLFRMTPILGAAVLLAMGISPLPAADVSAITAQLATISSLDGKLTVLQNTATGLSDNDKAALGAALIQSVAPADQKEAARRVAQILATGSADTAIFAALLANDLPASLASSLAGSIVIGASQTDPVHLPQITAAVINANSATIANAPGIAGEVTAAAPLSRASAIASSPTSNIRSPRRIHCRVRVLCDCRASNPARNIIAPQ